MTELAVGGIASGGTVVGGLGAAGVTVGGTISAISSGVSSAYTATQYYGTILAGKAISAFNATNYAVQSAYVGARNLFTETTVGSNITKWAIGIESIYQGYQGLSGNPNNPMLPSVRDMLPRNPYAIAANALGYAINRGFYHYNSSVKLQIANTHINNMSIGASVSYQNLRRSGLK